MEPLIDLELDLPALRLGVVHAREVQVRPSPPVLCGDLDGAVAACLARPVDDPWAARRRTAVRELLRGHGYRPTGRGKPASEYLERAARDGLFPRINNLVDINNLVSLQALLPVSMLDAARLDGRPRLRRGRPGERYVFNAAGQDIELNGLIVVCAGEQPLGSPVKDAMAGKVSDGTREVLAVLYASAEVVDDAELRRWTGAVAELLRAHAGAREVQGQLLRAGGDAAPLGA